MHHRSIRSVSVACLLALFITLTACAAPSASTEAPGAALSEQSPSPEQSSPADPTEPVTKPPPAATPERPSLPSIAQPGTSAFTLDYACSSDSDCAVKNVGNCCGYYPACLNKDSPTDPAAVKAQCAKSGRMGVCGFPSISSCQCVQGRCEGSSKMLPSL